MAQPLVMMRCQAAIVESAATPAVISGAAVQ